MRGGGKIPSHRRAARWLLQPYGLVWQPSDCGRIRECGFVGHQRIHPAASILDPSNRMRRTDHDFIYYSQPQSCDRMKKTQTLRCTPPGTFPIAMPHPHLIVAFRREQPNDTCRRRRNGVCHFSAALGTYQSNDAPFSLFSCYLHFSLFPVFLCSLSLFLWSSSDVSDVMVRHAVNEGLGSVDAWPLASPGR